MQTVFTLQEVFAFILRVRNSGYMTPPTRRQRHRAATVDEIKQAALDQIATAGAGALSIRGVARAIGMSPAGIYRYYDGLDSLITDLIADAYNDLADHIVAATTGPGSTLDRLRAGMLAYREWSLVHPNRFLLIFGTPIPGYAAPEDGPTEAANRRIGEAYFAVGAEAWERGELAPQPQMRPPEPHEAEFASGIAKDFPPSMVAAFLSAWAHFHGIVTLEILNQLDWIYSDPERFYAAEIERILEDLSA
jgi:AcrR family transcriptional regulator